MKSQFEPIPNTAETESRLGDRELDAALERAERILSEPINPRDFKNYSNVDADIAFVEAAESRFNEIAAHDSKEQSRARKLGRIFEAIIFEHAEQSNWLGANASTIQPSRFDDICNKVDAVVEFVDDRSASHLALAIDVTVSERFGEKFDHICNSIRKGELAEIKYFISDTLGFEGRLSNVPHVVLGVDRKTLYDIISKWIRGENRVLADHPIQVKLLVEIKTQLEMYRDYAKEISQSHLVPIYERALSIINGVIKEKNISDSDFKDAEKDEVVYAIQFNAKHLRDRK